MVKHVFKVKEDFYQKNIQVGDVISFVEGSYLIVDKQFNNQYGEFILCEYQDEFNDINNEVDLRETGISANENNPFEIVGTIYVPGYRNLLAGIGFYVKDRITGLITGLSFRETLDLLFESGATNAEGSVTKTSIFHSRLIDSIEGLPSFDSHYWKIPAYDEYGRPYAKLSAAAERELKKGLRYAIKNAISNYKKKFSFNIIESHSLMKVSSLINSSDNIVFLTGAGVSTMSGIPDYRSSMESIWKKDPEILQKLNENSFINSPENFWINFYPFLLNCLSNILPFQTPDSFLIALNEIKPNDSHYFFQWLEAEKNKDVTIITQNVDGLDKKAGSKKVIEYHGNINECICPVCGKSYDLKSFIKDIEIPRCSCEAVLRPNVVFFGDMIKNDQDARNAVSNADLVIVAGTSLNVYPFNTLLQLVKEKTKIVLINNDEGMSDNQFDIMLTGNVTTICRNLKEKLS